MVQYRRRQNHIESPFRQRRLPKIPLDSGHFARSGPFDPFDGPLDHRPGQIDQCTLRAGSQLQQLERIVTRPAADIQNPAHRMCGNSSSPGDQFHRQRRVDRRNLSGVQIGEPLHIVLEPLPDLLDTALIPIGLHPASSLY